MPKGISPLVAAVLLIAITMAIAAILANYVTGIVARQQQALIGMCPFGSTMNYVSEDYPKWEAGRIIAVIESNVALGDFRFSVMLKNDTVLTYPDIRDLELAPGIGDIRTEPLPFAAADVDSVTILTNCTNVRSEARPLR
jgi:flagellin-like protein